MPALPKLDTSNSANKGTGVNILRNNNSGVILITVLMLSFVLSLITLGILATYVSQVKTGQSVVDSIKAEQLAVGLAYREYQCQEWGLCGTPVATQTLDGKPFANSLVNVGMLTPPGSKIYRFTITY